MEDKKETVKLIAAMVLGDGHLGWRDMKSENRKVERPQYNRPVNSWYGSAHVTKNRDYVEWQCSILERICPVSLREYPERISTTGYTDAPKITYETRRHPFFTVMRQRFYVGGVKSVSPHDLKLFDMQSLAILFMDDGWIECDGRVGIATHSFTWADNKLLRDCIAEKLGLHLDVRVHKQKAGNVCYYLRAGREQGKRLTGALAESKFILPSFHYKISSERSTPETGDDIVSSLRKHNAEGVGIVPAS